ncbi:sulfate ABC transporter permease subunit CysW [Pseudorhodoplanes sp.]|uniref:sulfate ABC transporter permease subunit CysW n=1 Tax=Pseudorhodoplanes sp. TaxID=1934341 RepID=UPI002BE03FB9|nr:sulfate ABC transporter permease subunit CysW [Pseudorhodoplanes sp.]HWV51598.1 sulfate ABC transporter permease subunit CysW [Pseudorhodoplanes sp.]
MADTALRTRVGTFKVGGAPAVRRTLLAAVWVMTLLFIVAPLVTIIALAFAKGVAGYIQNLVEPATMHAIFLTVLTALVVVPINTAFGLTAAWAVTKFRFPGRDLLVTLIDLPYSISPIVAGVALLLVYGAQGLFGPFLADHGIKIMFALPAIFLASLFVTAPFVAREVIPLMQTQGTDEEEAALSLGASGWKTFMYVTLPSVRWSVIYGAILCNARVMGEFGAVSVVSGNIRGVTNTLPLQVELLYHDYNVTGAFAAASVLTLVALLTILARFIFEQRGAPVGPARH